MANLRRVYLMLFLVLSANPLHCQAFLWEVAGAVAGGAAVLVGAPIALGALGFSSTIGAGTFAAKMMSVAWTTGYGGGIVAGLQSAGAAGVGAASVIAGAATGAGTAHVLKKKNSKEDCKDDCKDD